MLTANELTCYLHREDEAWYALGNHRQWGMAFAAFPGGSDLSVRLGPEDVHVLALRLDGYGYAPTMLERLAADIVRWANEDKTPRAAWIEPKGKFKFVTELDPEVTPDSVPSPITGTWANVVPIEPSVLPKKSRLT